MDYDDTQYLQLMYYIGSHLTNSLSSEDSTNCSWLASKKTRALPRETMQSPAQEAVGRLFCGYWVLCQLAKESEV